MRPLPEPFQELNPDDFPAYKEYQKVYLTELESVPGEPLPELPDDAYGDDAVVLDEYEDDQYLD
jgi:hypothetical protein